ncbi:replication initiator [Cryptosporangium phraense]|uniref:Replication initiation protein n=1 Tax=Cryptosporangium phraense TaxID=2593070 RepID=A0A545AEL6_9ACTN|nr:replication initiator [Cryptosporangium phraense]TQS39710.1 replication initiation protein [Cryptosporangium phraense]
MSGQRDWGAELAAAGLSWDVWSGLTLWGRAGALPELAEQLAAVGGCARPVRLAGTVRSFSTATGELVGEYDTGSGRVGGLLVACGSRHASVCPSCAHRWRGDTWWLAFAGLVGGKGRAAGVRSHPRVFLTLTAPSFGAVHSRRLRSDGRAVACRARRGWPVCEHGEPAWCGVRHPEADPVVGAPLCVACYDWPGLVLWNSHAGALWNRWSVQTGREIGRLSDRPAAAVRAAVKVESTRVAEMQARGAVHLHAIVRADSGSDPDAPPPEWVTPELLAAAVVGAARRVAVEIDVPGVGGWVLRFGDQVEAHPIPAGADDAEERRLASYLAKYVTKDIAPGLERPVGAPGEIGLLRVPGHVRALVGVAWRLGGLPELAGWKLRRRAHQYGYRGPVATRSRGYSATLAALHTARMDYRREQAARVGADRLAPNGVPEQTVSIPALRLSRTGLDAAGRWLAEQTRADRETARRLGREEAEIIEGPDAA